MRGLQVAARGRGRSPPACEPMVVAFARRRAAAGRPRCGRSAGLFPIAHRSYLNDQLNNAPRLLSSRGDGRADGPEKGGRHDGAPRKRTGKTGAGRVLGACAGAPRARTPNRNRIPLQAAALASHRSALQIRGSVAKQREEGLHRASPHRDVEQERVPRQSGRRKTSFVRRGRPPSIVSCHQGLRYEWPARTASSS